MDLLEKAVINLVTKEPFFASLVMQMRRVKIDFKGEALAGVCVENGRIVLAYDPEEWEKLKLSVLNITAILKHECMHLILEHIIRGQNKDHNLFNIATDLVTNQFIDKTWLPKQGCFIGTPPFDKLPPNQTAEWYYEELKKNVRQFTIKQNKDGSLEIKDEKTGKTYHVDFSGTHKQKQDQKGVSKEEKELVKEVLKQAVKEAYQQAKSQGHMPYDIEELIQALITKPSVDWKKTLRQFIGTACRSKSKYTWMRESKRFGDVQKGRQRIRQLYMAVAIDTSGSIDNTDFNDFINEISGIQAAHKGKTIVMECDAKVQKVYELRLGRKLDTKFKGRGGTSFVPVFGYLEEKRTRPDVLVYLTDLYGDFPVRPPNYPTVWVKTRQSQVNEVPFGKLVKIENGRS